VDDGQGGYVATSSFLFFGLEGLLLHFCGPSFLFGSVSSPLVTLLCHSRPLGEMGGTVQVATARSLVGYGLVGPHPRVGKR
jgi:hypothetical protein